MFPSVLSFGGEIINERLCTAHFYDVLYTTSSCFLRNKNQYIYYHEPGFNKDRSQGRNVKRIREILGIKQETLATDLGFNQQKISLLEQKETIEPDLLKEIADAFKSSCRGYQEFQRRHS